MTFSSQLGRIVFLSDSSNAVAPISLKSYKSRRVTRLTMSGEVIAFSDVFDIAISYSRELCEVIGKQIPVQLFTDNKSFFDLIFKGSRAPEKRTMLDIAAARKGFRDKLISDIGFIRSNANVAYGLTKPMTQGRRFENSSWRSSRSSTRAVNREEESNYLIFTWKKRVATLLGFSHLRC